MFARNAISRVSRMPARELVRLKLLGLVALASLGFSAAPLAAECPVPLPENATAEQLIACLKDLKTQVVPAGAVMAFDLATGCPDGWGDFKDAGGRSVIGAGAGMNPGTDERDESIQTKKYRQHGGEEKVTLTDSEIPSHSHGVGSLSVSSARDFLQAYPDKVPTSSAGDPGIAKVTLRSDDPNYGKHSHKLTGETGLFGSGGPHNNMPPFIALYFCKKD